MSDTAKDAVLVSLENSNKTAKLPLLHGTIGPPVADIRKLYGDLGIFTFDPGYGGTAACDSKITYIDGDEGVLLHRGYPDRAARREIDLPRSRLPAAERRTAERRRRWRNSSVGVMHHTMLHEQLRSFYQRLPPRRASDGGDVRRGRRAVGLLSRQPGHQ